jgi:hypothetical protein
VSTLALVLYASRCATLLLSFDVILVIVVQHVETFHRRVNIVVILIRLRS